MKRILALCIVAVAMVFALPTAAFAAVDTNQAVVARGAELSEKYGIIIEHPTTADGSPAIGLNSLEILDQALATVTPSVVRQVSAFFEGSLGKKLSFEYEFSGGLDAEESMLSLGAFHTQDARIVLNLPTRTGTTIITGDNPVSIVHEFGHALHFMLQASYGADKLRGEWLSFNQGIGYNPGYIKGSPDEDVFLSGYAATMYEEDFAEVVGHCFILNKAGQGFTERLSRNGNATALGRKVAYVDSLLAAYFPNDAQMLANYRKTLSAPTTLSYQNLRISGASLQFIGYPQPRYVLDGTLNLLGKERADAVWLREIGGWYVLEPSGNELLVFPGFNVAEAPAGFNPWA